MAKPVKQKLDEKFQVRQDFYQEYDVQGGEMIPVETKELTRIEELPKPTQIEEDFNLVRENMKRLTVMTEETLEDAMRLAKETEAPRVYEVVGQIAKTLADMNQQLLESHKKKKDIEKKDTPRDSLGGGSINVEKGVFVGTSADLQKMLKEEETKSSS